MNKQVTAAKVGNLMNQSAVKTQNTVSKGVSFSGTRRMSATSSQRNGKQSNVSAVMKSAQ